MKLASSKQQTGQSSGTMDRKTLAEAAPSRLLNESSGLNNLTALMLMSLPRISRPIIYLRASLMKNRQAMGTAARPGS